MEWFYWLPRAVQVLLILGGILIIADFIIPSGGVLTASGLTAFMAAWLAWWDVSWWVYFVTLPPAAVGFIILCLWLLAKSGGMLERWLLPDRLKSNLDSMPGKRGVVKQLRSDGLAYVEVQGDRWLSVIEGGEALAVGSTVEVLRVDTGRLHVRSVGQADNP